MDKSDHITRLLDNGCAVILYKNGLSTYTAAAMSGDDKELLHSLIDTLPDDGPHITDDFSPSKALFRLSEKWIGNIVSGNSDD